MSFINKRLTVLLTSIKIILIKDTFHERHLEHLASVKKKKSGPFDLVSFFVNRLSRR